MQIRDNNLLAGTNISVTHGTGIGVHTFSWFKIAEFYGHSLFYATMNRLHLKTIYKI